jgi:two-component system, NtrC family, response regulator HydG
MVMTNETIRVLVIDDEPVHAETVAEGLERVGYECVIATSGKEGFKKIESEEWDVILTDLKMADLDGMQIVRKARTEMPDTEVVVITGHGDVKTAVEAIKLGASNYLTKPVELGELRAIVEKATQRVRLTRANRELKRQLDEKFGYEGVVGNSPLMHDLIARLRTIAPTSATVLIRGETGTGKELVARAIHQNSPRKNKPFVPLNCTAFNENLLDDELFGHESGAFTGADRLRKGRFEHANGGTLFLDEVGDMPLPLQAKLLRVLENREVFRIGSNEPIKINVRVLSATHKDLEAMVNEGKFRQDLLFRLKVVTVKLPPLRDRREDVQMLSAHFIKEFNAQHGKRVAAIAEPVRKAMAIYSWPGNVRELRNFLESAVVQDTDGIINLDDVEESDVVRKTPMAGQALGPGNLVGRPLTEVERFYIEQALALTEGNREEAARMLGIGERTLYRVMNEWKLQDRIRQGLQEANGNMAEAAKRLNMKLPALERKIKKWGWQPDSLPATV